MWMAQLKREAVEAGFTMEVPDVDRYLYERAKVLGFDMDALSKATGIPIATLWQRRRYSLGRIPWPVNPQIGKINRLALENDYVIEVNGKSYPDVERFLKVLKGQYATDTEIARILGVSQTAVYEARKRASLYSKR
jgi:uncharacterized protein (DUF2384 family)